MAWLARPAGRPHAEPVRQRTALVGLVEAPGGRGASTATALARALAADSPAPGAVLLADLTLDAPHRGLHGIDPDAEGLSELATACRFGPPPPGIAPGVIQRTVGGYDLLPGLRQHHDWVSIGSRAMGAVLGALLAGHETVIAHVDRDLEGEPDTGSFDVEDRNVLARTAVRAADLVVVVGDGDRAGRQALLATLVTLAAFGTPPERTLVVADRLPRRSARAEQRLGAAVRAALAESASRTAPGDDAGVPERIVPGSLGR